MIWLLSNSPSLAPGSSVPADAVTPGPIGFLWMAIVVAIAILLGLDMVRRVRKVKYRQEVRERLAAEMSDSDAASTGQGPEN